ncbi:sulfurtransferase [Biformimicrobium ophioploci]|uniref:Thiosulfate sulfurtransferase n=1 Tax=Biformimicrobium ophioploci TaxID=3036711 RepID=A0ABQ6LV03_9GAMM|nr:sulfurtransferase [Microbulbifer sp. NKW57]GMG85891.1 thiosulfate sulfurtransferase [Microbulbifer sp. NKW57]
MADNLPYILEPQELQAAMDRGDKLLVLDLCAEDRYTHGHIPGAIYVPPRQLMAGTPPAPGKFPPHERITALLRSLGIEADTHVVAYDDEGGGWAGRLLWTLDVAGHRNNSYLNGGYHAWEAAGLPLSQEVPAPTPSDFEPAWDEASVSIDLEEIMQRLQAGTLQVLDARSPAEYRGERVLALKGGHIPGAINCEWTSLMDPQRDLRIRTDAAEHLAALGFDKERELVTHCQSHHRSGFTYLVGKSLGYRMRAYPGSWSEWGNTEHTPVEP